MKENANNPDELKELIKQHYKERKIFSKLVENWNNEKEKYKSGFFYDVLDTDFLNFILKEIEINKAVDKANKEDNFLEKILFLFISNRRVELILESKFSRIFEEIKKSDFNFLIYVREENINYFFSEDFINKMKSHLNKQDIFVVNRQIYFESDDNKNIFINFKEIHKINYEYFSYDTNILYNPYGLEINILDKETFRNKILEKVYKDILVNLKLFSLSYNKQEFINSSFLLNKLNNNFYTLISINNYKFFEFNQIKDLINNQNNELEKLLYKIITTNFDIKENYFISFIPNLINLIEESIKSLEKIKN
ncbi:MAG: hypothetical protein KatS3mg068_1769 [Candidatus Sericytochromatia bacterium]|nr:MAG: hypothetical protein KatS3mg068_1769 [Candidatus Sericytochromatia bacterium]